MRERSGSSVASGSPLRGAGNGVVGRQRIVPGGRSQATRARASARVKVAHCRSGSEMVAARARLRATLHAMRGFSRSIQSLKVSQASPDWSMRWARAHTDRPGGASISSRASFTSSESRQTIGRSAAAVSSSARPKASAATTRRVSRVVAAGSPSITSETRANVSASRANHPVVSEAGAWRVMPVRSSRPWVGRIP